jgi:hypothetical protein
MVLMVLMVLMVQIHTDSKYSNSHSLPLGTATLGFCSAAAQTAESEPFFDTVLGDLSA